MEHYFYYNYGFYASDVHGTNIPEGAIELAQEQYFYLLAGQSNGKRIEPDESGMPVLVDIQIDAEVLAQRERNWRDSELKRADIELYKVQDTDPNAVGTVGDWRSYRKALRSWPADTNFPNQSNRPRAPDNQI